MSAAITEKELLAKLIFQAFTITDDKLINQRWESADTKVKANYRRAAEVLIDNGYHRL